MTNCKGLGAILTGLSVLGGTAMGQTSGGTERAPVIRGVSQVLPKVMVGKPIPLKINSPAPALLPETLRAGQSRTANRSSGVVPTSTVPPPGTVIATSYREVIHAQPKFPPLDEMVESPEWDNDSTFAIDRRPPRGSRAMPLGPASLLATPSLAKNKTPQPTFPTTSANNRPASSPVEGPSTVPPASVTPALPTATTLHGVIDAAHFTRSSWKRTYNPIDGDLPPLTVVEQPELLIEQDGNAPRVYAAAEYLLWWTKRDNAPPLVTTGAADPLVASPGALGNADTVILQDGNLGRGPQSGLRATVGFWLDDCAGKAIEVSGFFLGSRSATFSAASPQFPVLSRPFFDVVAGAEEVELVSFPGLIAGNISVRAPSELWGLEANLICPISMSCNSRVNFLLGPRYLHLAEAINIVEDLQFLNDINGFQAGQRVRVADSFRTRNQFWGGQVGVEGRWLQGRFTVDGRARIALGVTHQDVTIDGTQTFLQGVNPDPRPGGLLAVGSNIGTQRRSNFSVVPEVNVNLGYYVTDWMRLSVGYNALWWTNVVRPGDQIDRNVNPFLVPNFSTVGLVNNGAAQPTVPFRTTDFWAHGLTFGVELTY
ncbi:MAG: BBP7 family outer membrane beta-barrel protein [Gemmataceae bacterium]